MESFHFLQETFSTAVAGLELNQLKDYCTYSRSADRGLVVYIGRIKRKNIKLSWFIT